MEIIIRNLIGLQGCDFEIKLLNKKKEEGPAKIKVLEEELKQVEGAADEELVKAEAVKKERRQIEQEIEDLAGRVEKSKVKLANIKSNKEYEAALKEIDDLEREKSVFEDKALQIMEEIDSLDEKLSTIKMEKETHREKFESDQKIVEKKIKALEKECRKFDKERKKIRKEIDQDLLKYYDNLLDHKEGIAVCSVSKGICQACHMGIPPQKFNELMRGDVLMNCPHCGRIMYWGDDERFKDPEEEE